MDRGLFDEMVDGGYVRVQSHPTLPLLIANYTEKAQYEQVWNDVTTQCRGLIFQNDGGLVHARPYRKFFNYGDAANTGPLELAEEVVVTDKLDGSLGISYIGTDGLPAVATRGSFTSEQARHATDLLRTKYPSFRPLPGFTYLWEIVYPENRIVVDYGHQDDLFLHGVIHIRDGRWISDYGWPGPRVEQFEHATLAEALLAPPRDNAEGLVVRYVSTGAMVKIKQADYVALHRVLTNTSARILWQHLAVNACTSEHIDVKLMTRMLHLDPARILEIQAAGPNWLATMLSAVPDEFFSWVRTTIAGLVQKVEDTTALAHKNAARLNTEFSDDRKAIAQAAFAELTRDEIDLVFPILDGRPIVAQTWFKAYPGVDRPFTNRNESIA